MPNPIISEVQKFRHFNFDDETRNWLKAEVKNKDVTTNAKVTLDENESYDLTVYMNIIGIDIPIFVSEQKAVGEMNSVDFDSTMKWDPVGDKEDDYSYFGVSNDGFLSYIKANKAKLTVTPIGKNGSFKCTANMNEEYQDATYRNVKQKGTFTFTVYKQTDGSFGKAQDLEWQYEEEIYNTLYKNKVRNKESGKATDIPLTWTNKDGTSFIWKGNASDGVKLTSYSYSGSLVDENGKTLKSYSISKPKEFKLSIGANFDTP